MSQDIHAWIEVQFQDGDKPAIWVSDGRRREINNYAVFDLMASSRDVVRWIIINALKLDPLRTNAALRMMNNLGLVWVDGWLCYPPKGIPPDASNWFQVQCDDYGSDGHSHSWLTLAELRLVQQRLATLPGVEPKYPELFEDWRKVARINGVNSPEAQAIWQTMATEEVQTGYGNPDLNAIVAEMERAEALTGRPSRLVFFFDN